MTDEPNCQKYGVPFYGASWVPPSVLSRSDLTKSDREEKPKEEEETDDIPKGNYLVFAGGGGEGRSGIPNAIVVSEFDFASNSLSATPVAKLGTGTDLPYRMTVHPGGEGLICSLPNSCRWFEWDAAESSEVQQVCVKASEKELPQLENIGQQLALSFSSDGSMLALGDENGYLRVFKWPSMEVIIDEEKAHSSVKDLHFSPDGRFLVSIGRGSPCRIWDMKSSTAIASLSKENDEVFGFGRFSQTSDGKQVLYIAAMRGQGGYIVMWNTDSWKRRGSKQVVRDPISAFDVSADGKLLAIGTVQGDIYIINSAMAVQMIVKKAHLGLVTALMFSNDTRALVSSSLDSSARVTLVVEKQQKGLSLWVVLLFIVLAISAYFIQTKGYLP
ncbi:Anaphase-promoting complex subunit 4, WD40 domain [Dillenia turbinata]|uniref:Anaphase-promoting complex subunit 4, WD40 domain n=1 Tax=Dillenia turbinata TaxID=194707 RepID=A0AAN8VJV3_9MAGN